MNPSLVAFEKALTPSEKRRYRAVRTPFQAQQLLDALRYCGDDDWRSPLEVLRKGKTCCFEGALLAAACLLKEGYPPRILFMVADGVDDDHILFVFKEQGCWGAVAKSNYATLRYREPVYRTLRELVMSYFDFYYDDRYLKTLRAYTRPLDLTRFSNRLWTVRRKTVEAIDYALDRLTVRPLFKKSRIKDFAPMDERTFRAGKFDLRKRK